MASADGLVDQLEQTGQDIFWQGGASDSSIRTLETLIGSPLPLSFRRFLQKYGGGGVVEEEISGIEEDDATLENKGTVYGDALRCREEFGLPSHLAVIYLGPDDNVVGCLDTSRFSANECPVVSFTPHPNGVSPVADNFQEFFHEYLAARLAR